MPTIYREAYFGGVSNPRGPRELRRWKHVQTVEVTWVPKIKIYKDRRYGSNLWWTCCGACRREFRAAYSLSVTYEVAVRAAARHALVVHEVKL